MEQSEAKQTVMDYPVYVLGMNIVFALAVGLALLI